MIRILVLLAIFIVLSSGLAVVSKRYIEQCLPIAMFLIIIIMYVSGCITKNLNMGCYVVYIITLLSLTVVIMTLKKGKMKEVIQYCITPGLIIYCCVFVFIAWLNRGRMFTVWDEFSHWGLVVKNMYLLDTFGNVDSATTIFKDYPPATALFQYFVLKVCGSYSEGKVLSAMGWLISSMLIPRSSWNKKYFINAFGGTFILLFMPVLLYEACYSEVYVDAIMGVMFAYIMYFNFVSKYYDKYTCISNIISMFVLGLVKDTGVALALIAGVIIMCDKIYQLIISSDRSKKIIIRTTIDICAILGSVAISKYSWSIYLHSSATNYQTWSYGSISFSGIINVLCGKGQEYQYITISKFGNKLLNPCFANISYIGWFAIIIVIFIAILKLMQPDEVSKKRLIVSFIGIMLGFVIYTISLLVLYIYIYSEGEATDLASYVRYLSTYLLGILLYEAYVFVYYILNHSNQVRSIIVSALVILIAFMGVLPIIDMTVYRTKKIRATAYKRSFYQGITRYENILDSSDNIWYISQKTNGYDYYVSRYNMTPVHLGINEQPAVRLGIQEADGYDRVNYTVQEWARRLKKSYTYVYLYEIDDQFLDKYSSLFENMDDIKDDRLYKICVNDGEVVLKYIDED